MKASGSGVLPREALEVLTAYRERFGDIRVWSRRGDAWSVEYGPPGPTPDAPDGEAIPVKSRPRLWLEPVELGSGAPDPSFLAFTLARLVQLDLEAREIGKEISERYEEITLLYSISEILGSVISLEEAADEILREVTLALGVERASLWVGDDSGDALELIACVGDQPTDRRIPVDDQTSVTAAVYRTRRALILEADEEFPREREDREDANRGSFLSVPVSYSPPDGETRTIGVINLIGRRSEGGFSAGDQKLVSAIASQVGAALENSRLVAQSLRRERIEREMELAHDLQLKLLPPVEQFSGFADVAARCAPADSVGGDFYQLFRLSGDRLGVMIGDVSSHGFGAALIMALTMSATASRASEGESPSEVLRRAHHMLIDELESTEMYLTLFYGVIDPAARAITYSNAGHSHAFRLRPDGAAIRLDVTDPPFGIVDRDDYSERTIDWAPGEDTLVLFTDGLSDALGVGEIAGVERVLSTVRGALDCAAAEMLDRLFRIPAEGATPPDDRTAVLVRI